MVKIRYRRRLTLKQRKIKENPKTTQKLRIRCPVCGFLCWQSQLAKMHNIEFMVQTLNGQEITYKKIESPAGIEKMIAGKLRDIANRLFPDILPINEISFQPEIKISQEIRNYPNKKINPEVKLWQ